MITPKEKARYLVDKYIEEGICFVGDYSMEKSCALTAVEEILEFEKRIVKQIENYLELFKEMEFKTESYYWQEVKEEIEKL